LLASLPEKIGKTKVANSSTDFSNPSSMRRRDKTMKRNYRHRPLTYEQLESKASPSSILMVVPGDGTDTELAAVATSSIATDSSRVSYDRYETDQILRFVAENTADREGEHRPATLPTAAQCIAADEMMTLIPAEWSSLLVLGCYEDGTEL
jgi:hypothetical protein